MNETDTPFGGTDAAPPLHAIRLRGAWTVTPAGDRVRHARRFGWPTARDPHERVWLVCAAVPERVAVEVNGVAFASVRTVAGEFAADITHALNARNELVIEVPAGVALGSVTLEVRAAPSADA